ncbi:MAG: 1,4-dihydroxy-2-naphthoate octaprenyltransferase, partial [Odoribacter sp.]|nr:1,4-dihydroxy-2-naphthoate octaprenyltransferase [Odoribacter sp.]
MSKLKYYIHSFRLRTLPLSVSGIILGGLLAKSAGEFNVAIFTLAIITTLLLQIVSNLANELGDLQKGTDNNKRLGPIRSIQSGALTVSEFKRILIWMSTLALIAGLWLVFLAFHNLINLKSIGMLLLGGLALAAAIKYTMGKHAYGYYGLGDIFVFIFFGIISTAGCYFLMIHQIKASILLPASAIGFLSTGVLNINNIRDIENDKACNKRTIPVKIGEKNAKRYHI